MADDLAPPRIEGTSRAFAAVLNTLRTSVRRLRTNDLQVSTARKVGITLLMLVPFSAIVFLLRLRHAVKGPIRVDAPATDGLMFECHPPDMIQLYLWVFGIWEPDITHLVRSRLTSGDVFVDVGANIGYFTLLASGRIGVEGTAVAVEASPAVFAHLNDSLRRNGEPGNIRTVNMAAAAQAGSLPIYGGPGHNTGLSSTVERWGRPQQATVEALPLDEILLQHELAGARVVKIDVEGGEDQVLAGMTKMIREAPPSLEILLELSPRWWRDKTKRPIDVLRPFLDSGFNVYKMENNYWPWRYMWPACVRAPRRMRDGLERRDRRIDLVLSRTDSESL
ncbi:MAG: FkbM family methyltransferase [Gemmatimonadales bacterium]